MEEEKEKKEKTCLEKLKECERLKAEYLAGWQRERAGFLNYKKEEIQRLKGFLQSANENLILELLPILDNLEIAEINLPKELKENSTVKGFLQTKQQLLNFLKQQGLETIEVLGKKFDPNLQEVVGEIESKEEGSGIVLQVIKKGYKLHGKVVRPAKVKISK